MKSESSTSVEIFIFHSHLNISYIYFVFVFACKTSKPTWVYVLLCKYWFYILALAYYNTITNRNKFYMWMGHNFLVRYVGGVIESHRSVHLDMLNWARLVNTPYIIMFQFRECTTGFFF